MENNIFYIASDHAGFELKTIMLHRLKEKGLKFEDLGPQTDERVDYPDFADRLCLKIKDNPTARGILICGSGQGMAIRANRYPFIRAALCWDEESCKLSREHNNANVLCVGSRLLEKELIFSILDVFVKTEFEGGRHEARVDKLNQPAHC